MSDTTTTVAEGKKGMDKGHKAIWWVMSIVQILFVTMLVGYASNLKQDIRDAQKEIAIRNERVAMLEVSVSEAAKRFDSYIVELSRRLTRMEDKLDNINRKVGQ